jgi:hypothetical protein
MDDHNLWADTLLIVNTDHGFLLTEHHWWGKVMMPYYNEIAHIPLFIWDPRIGVRNKRISSLVQTVDIAPTLLDFFGTNIPKDMRGKPLRQVIEADGKAIRDYALFGQHGAHVNITDGKYVYMRAAVPGRESCLYNYIQFPASYSGAIDSEVMRTARIHSGFSFTKGSPVLRIQGGSGIKTLSFPPKNLFEDGSLLFDVQNDPKQLVPLKDREIEDRMIKAMIQLMLDNDCPEEQYERLGLRPY